MNKQEYLENRVQELECRLECEASLIADMEVMHEDLLQDFKTLLYALQEQKINTDIL